MDAKESASLASKWLAELKLAQKEDEKWVKRSEKIVQRYRDNRQDIAIDTAKRFNILWANVQTTLPALYGKTPRAQVERRFKDQDPIGRTASMILERALQYEIDHYGDFDAACKSAVLDRLLPGRGVAWVRFEQKEIAEAEVAETETEETGEDISEGQYECTPTDYVFWQDFRCSPARSWEEVTWVARRVYMSRDEGMTRFGDDFKQVPLTHEPIGLDEMRNQGASQGEIDSLKKAQVWEIWNKTDKTVIWVAETFQRALDYKKDPYGLDSFWPCPKPLYATQTTDTLVPVPDYAMYQDQAMELDKLTQRIGMLVDAVKTVGVYDASQDGVKRMLDEGVNNTLIPVDNWAAMAEKGGIKGVVDFLPLDMVIQALNECYKARDVAKQVIYEITGLSDIIRGASVASETATAQQIKSQYASLRIKRTQTDVAQFASEILRIKAQMMADLYTPQNLIQMSGILGTDDAQYAEQAVMLLKQEPARSFRIEVASDSLVEMDEQGEKAARVEFLGAVGAFMEKALPVAQQVPELAPLMGEMLMFGVRAFKGGRPMEAAFDSAMAQLTAPKQPKPPQPDPEQIKQQAETEREQMRMQGTQAIEQMRLQGQAAIEEMRLNNSLQLEQMRLDRADQQFMAKTQVDREMQDKKLADGKEAREASAKPAVNMQGVTVQGAEILGEVAQSIGEMTQNTQAILEQNSQAIQSVSETMAQTAQMVAAAVSELARPKKKTVVRGKDGKAIGLIEE